MKLIQADVVEWVKAYRAQVLAGEVERFHAVFGDPPYFLGSISKRFGKEGSAPAKDGKDGAFGRVSAGFMNKQWDGFSDVHDFQRWVTSWAEPLLDCVYPGALVGFFGGTRTYHRLTCGLEDAGWEILDCIGVWLYGTGFSKGTATSERFKKLRQAGLAIEGDRMALSLQDRLALYREEKQWAGYNHALKPSWEPIVLARAPKGNRTHAELCRQFGTGALNIDGGRIEAQDADLQRNYHDKRTGAGSTMVYAGNWTQKMSDVHPLGRYPTNTIFSCTCNGTHEPECPVGQLEAQSPGVSKYYYQPKASTAEREWGLETFEQTTVNDGRQKPIDNPFQRGETKRRNTHPTVKPVRLTEYISTLLLMPPLDVPRRILIPFAGTGSEMIGAHMAGWDDITGIELDDEYIPLNRARTAWWTQYASYDEARRAAGEPDEEDAPDVDDGLKQLGLWEVSA